MIDSRFYKTISRILDPNQKAEKINLTHPPTRGNMTYEQATWVESHFTFKGLDFDFNILDFNILYYICIDVPTKG